MLVSSMRMLLICAKSRVAPIKTQTIIFLLFIIINNIFYEGAMHNHPKVFFMQALRINIVIKNILG